MDNEKFLDYQMELLQLNSKYGILTMGNVLEQVPMSKKMEQVRKIHPYSITPPTKSNQRWQTRYKNENSGKYKNLQAPT